MVPFDEYKFLNLAYTNVKINLLLQLVLIMSYLRMFAYSKVMKTFSCIFC